MSGNIDKITDGLYIGNQYDALDQEIIDTYDIRTVINCTKNNERVNMAINYLQIPLDDPPTEQDIALLDRSFYASIQFIDNSISNGHNVLVHCKIGSQRSPTIVAIYLMVKYSTNYEDAIEYIQSVRPIAFFGEMIFSESLQFVQLKLSQMNNKINNSKKLIKLLAKKTNKQINPFAHRKHVYDENKYLCLEGDLKNVKSFPSTKIEFDNGIIPIPLYDTATIQVLDMDHLHVAKLMIDNDYKPLILNVGHEAAPCNNTFCQENLLDAQEELLICRTNLFLTLNDDTDLYPNKASHCIYSPEVLIFRDDELNILEKPYFASFVTSCPAIGPRLINGRMDDPDYNDTFAKIDAIFQIGMSKGFDSLVLSAFGCSNVFGIPVYQIVGIFNKCLQRWKNSFKIITFAIPSNDRMDDIKENSVCNYNFFKQYITI
jgi:uncharacterized protein (TIGR02452 family)